MARLYSTGHTSGATYIGANDLDVKSGDLIAIKGGFANKAVVGDKVEAISVETKTFASDNETVAGEGLVTVKLADNSIVEVKVDGGTISQTNVGEEFNLNADGNVDGSASVPEGQLRLKEVKSETLGLFYRV